MERSPAAASPAAAPPKGIAAAAGQRNAAVARQQTSAKSGLARGAPAAWPRRRGAAAPIIITPAENCSCTLHSSSLSKGRCSVGARCLCDLADGSCCTEVRWPAAALCLARAAPTALWGLSHARREAPPSLFQPCAALRHGRDGGPNRMAEAVADARDPDHWAGRQAGSLARGGGPEARGHHDDLVMRGSHPDEWPDDQMLRTACGTDVRRRILHQAGLLHRTCDGGGRRAGLAHSCCRTHQLESSLCRRRRPDSRSPQAPQSVDKGGTAAACDRRRITRSRRGPSELKGSLRPATSG